MKLFASLFAIVLLSSPALSAEPVKKLTVHEWGVFRVHEDVEMANASLRSIWDGLPPFVYGNIRGRLVPQHWGAFEERSKPILFFHAVEPALIVVKLDFPGGMPGVWWPGTQIPAIYGNAKQPPIGKLLQWELAVKQPPADWQPKSPTTPEVEKGHWFEQIRAVKSDEIFSRFGPGQRNVEREKFLYYDGLFPHAKWLKFDVEKENVMVTSRVKHPVFDVTLVDRRAEGKVRVGRLDKLEAGAVAKISFTEVDASRFTSEAADALMKQLVTAGLFEDEAKSLLDIWRKEMFETPGLHAFHRLPSTEYDRLLPLTITPAPTSVVRVGLVFHGHLETDLGEKVQELIRLLDSPRFAVRVEAKRKLKQLGPVVLVHLKKLKEKDLSTEVWKQVAELIKEWDAKAAFE